MFWLGCDLTCWSGGKCLIEKVVVNYPETEKTNLRNCFVGNQNSRTPSFLQFLNWKSQSCGRFYCNNYNDGGSERQNMGFVVIWTASDAAGKIEADEFDDAVWSKIWPCYFYLWYRRIQEAITDNTEIAVSPRSLHSELMCPICLDMLKKTMTTKECLHRFCSECIITALRSGNKECPTCRKKLVSKRSLRPDPNFDLLISKIYPSRDEYEAIQERVLAKVNQSHSQQALVNSIAEGIKSQSQQRAQRVKKSNEEGGSGGQREHRDSVNSNNSSTTTNNGVQNGETVRETASQGTERQGSNPPSVRSTPSPSPSNTSSFSKLKRSKSVLTSERSDSESNSEMESRAEGESNFDTDAESSEYGLDEIELVFKPHPVEMGPDNALMKVLKENSVRYLKTTANATIDHLSKYLAMRLTLDLQKQQHPEEYRLSFLIYIAPQPNQFVVLVGAQSLSQIQEKFWKINKPLELFYTWKNTTWSDF